MSKNRTYRMMQVLSLLAGAVCWISTAEATTLLLDLGNDTAFRSLSTASPDENGNYWTSVDSSQFWSDLVDINGTTSSIDFGFSSVSGADSYNGPAGATSADTNSPNYYVTKVTNTAFNAMALGDLGATNAVFDYYVSSSFVFEDLDPTKYYKLTFFGSHKYNTDEVTTYSVTDSNGVVLASADLTVGVGVDHNQDKVARITNIQANDANKIYVSFEGSEGNSGYLNALKLEELDEPEMEEASNLVLIDFGADNTYRALSVVNPDENGNFWNNRGFSTLVNMVTADNGSTEIDLVATSGYGVDSFNGPAGSTSTDTNSADYYVTKVASTAIDAVALGDLGSTNACFDYFSGTVTFELQDLDPSTLYNLTFYGSRKFSSDATTRYSVTDSNGIVLASADLDVHEPGSAWLHNQDTTVTISNVAPDAADTIYVTFTGTGGGSGYLNALQVEILASTNSGYSIWADSFGLVGGEGDDDDNDGWDNLYEYGLGGNPTNGFVDGNIPVFSTVGGSLELIHAQRSDDDQLSYYLEVTSSLTSPAWTNSGVAVTGTNVVFGDFDYVTNSIPVDVPEKFIRLIIEK